MSISKMIRAGLIAAVSLAMVSTDVLAQRGERGGGWRSRGGDSGRSSRGDSGRSSRSFGRSIQRDSGRSSRSFGRSFQGDSGRSQRDSGRSSRSFSQQFRGDSSPRRSIENRGFRGLIQRGDSGIQRSDGIRSRSESGQRLEKDGFRQQPSQPQGTQRRTFRLRDDGRSLLQRGDSERVRDFRRGDGRDGDGDFFRRGDVRGRDGRREDGIFERRGDDGFFGRRGDDDGDDRFGRRRDDDDWRRRGDNWDFWFRRGGFAGHRDWDFDRRRRHHRDWHHGHWHHRSDFVWSLWPYYWSSGYRYGYWPYYNPYYTSDLFVGGPIYDYSQPIVVRSYGDSLSSAESRAFQQFDAARAAFRSGAYERALAEVDGSIRVLENDPALHEFRGLVLFALGRYEEAAATVYAVLSAGPGWDWSTLVGLYPSVSIYTGQLRALEAYVRENPDAARARFLLGYHYLTMGHTDSAERQFQQVAELEPEDQLTPQLLRMLRGEGQSANAAGDSEPPALPAPPRPPESRSADGPAEPAATFEADQLVGSWTASREGSSFELTLAANGRFTWQFEREGRAENLEGNFSLAGDRLVLEPAAGTPMVARISDFQDDQFRFVMLGGPEDDTGLVFEKESN